MRLRCSQAWLLGRNENYQLSWPLPEAFTTSHNGTDGSPSATPAAGFPFRLTDLPDSNAPAELKRQRIVSAACGRGNTVLVTDQGQAWTAGANMVGQSGHANIERLQSFTRVQGALAREKVVAASCGVNFTVFLTDDGKCYTVGSGEKGQLGNGRVSLVVLPVSHSPNELISAPRHTTDWRAHCGGSRLVHRAARPAARAWRNRGQEDRQGHVGPAAHRRPRRRWLCLRMGLRRCVLSACQHCHRRC